MTKKSFKASENPAMQFISSAGATQAAADPADGLTIPKGYVLAPESKSVRMQLLVTPTIKDGIKASADAQGLSMNDLINKILMDYLQKGG